MNLSSRNLKLIFGAFYLFILFVGLYFLFSSVDIRDLTSYDFIRSNKNIILHYKEENFFLLTFVFFIFCIIWVLLLGFASPLLLFAGFVFGKWWGITIALLSTSIGATLLYIMAGMFFRKVVEEKLAPKFSKFREYFSKNDLIYFMCFRFVGGGGIPYAIQNVLPVLFNMSSRNYFFGTLFGSLPSMFITVSLGAGIEKVIDENERPGFFNFFGSPDIYLPIIGFFLILIIGIILKNKFFKK